MTDQQTIRSDSSADSSQPTVDDLWRKEIHARVAGYRNRRGRRIEGAFTMRFPFPPSEITESDASVEEQGPIAAEEIAAPDASALVDKAAVVEEPVALLPEAASLAPAEASEPIALLTPAPEQAEEPAPLSPVYEAEADPLPRPAPAPRPTSRRKVIAFPRQVSEAPAISHRLADPVIPEQPRILDVPEELEAYPSTPLLDGLQFPASPQQSAPADADHIELPFRAISIGQRLYAGLIDCLVVAAACGVFGAVCYKMLPKLQFTKPVMLTAAAVPVLLWAVYHYVLVVYGCTTAGMRVAGVRITTFKGTNPRLRHRRTRVIGLYFSTASLLMGLLWALVDVDALCWHDRISRTYLTSRQ